MGLPRASSLSLKPRCLSCTDSRLCSSITQQNTPCSSHCLLNPFASICPYRFELFLPLLTPKLYEKEAMMLPILLAINSHWCLNLVVYLFPKIISRLTMYIFIFVIQWLKIIGQKRNKDEVMWHSMLWAVTLWCPFSSCVSVIGGAGKPVETPDFDPNLSSLDIHLERFRLLSETVCWAIFCVWYLWIKALLCLDALFLS